MSRSVPSMHYTRWWGLEWLEQAQGHDARGWGLDTRPLPSWPKTLLSLSNSGGQAAALETRSLDEGEKEKRIKLRNLSSTQILPKVNFSEKWWMNFEPELKTKVMVGTQV